MELVPVILSLKLSAVTTVLLFVFCLPAASLLTSLNKHYRNLLDALSFLPMVLPPTVLGFYMLLLFSPYNFIGGFLEDSLGVRFVFNFWGMVLASCVFSFPLMLLPIKNGFENIDQSLVEASYTLGKSKLQTLFHIILPNIKSYLALGALTTFAHTMGEFGVVLMVGGNIPGETKVLSIALFEKVEELDYASAHIYSLVLVGISLLIIILILALNGKMKREVSYDFG
ncbi:MAG: molybdate ABC transporter permease subunit [Ignavibacteria bacterium]|jgi:molybdate transport system permease protein